MKSVQIDIEKVIEKQVYYLDNDKDAQVNAIDLLMMSALSKEDYQYFYQECLKRMK